MIYAADNPIPIGRAMTFADGEKIVAELNRVSNHDAIRQRLLDEVTDAIENVLEGN